MLSSLRVTPLQVVLQMQSTWTGPALKTLLLRSGLGFHLRRRECLTGAQQCAGCARQRECWYSFAFESPADLLSGSALQRRDGQNAHPFYLASAPIAQRILPPGTDLPCLLTVFGQPEPLLSRLLWALEEAGISGKWGGAFRIRSVISPLRPSVRLSADGRSGREEDLQWPHWRVPPPRAVRGVRLRFLSPLRLRIQGTLVAQPSFPEIVRALLRRIHILSGLYGSITPPAGWTLPLLEQAAQATPLTDSWSYFAEHRASGRQKRHIRIDGICGEISLAGDLAGLWPFLDLCQWIGIGASTGHGLGAYVLDHYSGTE